MDNQGWPDHIEVVLVSDKCNQGTIDAIILYFVLQTHIDISLDMVHKQTEVGLLQLYLYQVFL